MDEIQSPITTIPGISVRMGAIILAYAGMSPSTYQSGQLSLSGTYSHMEKRGSRYLRYALYNATKYVCLWDPTFAAFKGYSKELSQSSCAMKAVTVTSERSRMESSDSLDQKEYHL